MKKKYKTVLNLIDACIHKSNYSQIRILDDDSTELEEGYPSDVSSGSESSSDSEDSRVRHHVSLLTSRIRSESNRHIFLFFLHQEDGSPKRRKIDRRLAQSEYYRGSSYATPASLLAYELATLLNRDSNDILW